jgi:demethylmenaquinone methyltransferase/2-methoxy-6-polyprenyl-1,4-benzoquinol methylase
MNKGIQKIFGEVPRTYELVNHILTFGMDIIARRKAARMAVSDGGTRWLDACSGTGEMAANLVRLSGEKAKVFAADFSVPMLTMAARKPEGNKINFVISDVSRLPFPDSSFDLITISFATRNINTSRENLIKTVAEFHRILKPKGRFVNLETSQPSLSLARNFMHFYVKIAVKPIGSFISGSKAGYTYLSQTIPRFYPPNEFSSIIKEAGFSEVAYKRLFGGIIAIHKAVK